MSATTEAAKSWAHDLHESQKYGDQSYIVHLSEVVGVLFQFSITDDVMQVAAWLHDSVEDTDTTIEQVRERFGDEVAELVGAVTSEPGKNRKERNAATYPKVARLMRARVLKLADRIANVEHAWNTKNPILFMYQREYRDFRGALRPETPWGIEVQMWNHLDKLLGWWEPPGKERQNGGRHQER